jgi:hypothetical protein
MDEPIKAYTAAECIGKRVICGGCLALAAGAARFARRPFALGLGLALAGGV